MRKILVFILSLSLVHSTSFATEGDLFSNLDYPELQVSPRATERLAQLAEMEEKNTILLEWTMITSGLMTMMAGLQQRGNYRQTNPSDQEMKDSDMSATAAAAVGAGWVAVGTAMGLKKWSRARLAEVRRIQGKDKRSDLARERIAEEALEYAANTTRMLEKLSFTTNLVASLYVTSYATDDNRVYGLLAVTASFLPLIFPNVYGITYEKHLEYKRKIYAPLVGVSFTDKMDPMMQWTWTF